MTDTPVKNTRWEDKTLIVEVQGDIDLHRSPELQQQLTELLNQKPQRVIVNLADVPYMDSSGVASLVKLLSRTRKVGVDLALVAPTQKVRSIMEITRLDSVFRIADSEDEVLSS